MAFVILPDTLQTRSTEKVSYLIKMSLKFPFSYQLSLPSEIHIVTAKRISPGSFELAQGALPVANLFRLMMN